MMNNVIQYSVDKTIAGLLIKDDKCSFCLQSLVKGKYIRSENSPAICFACVVRCVSLLKDDEPLDFDDDPE